METVKRREETHKNTLKLRKAFTIYVAIAFGVMVAMSMATIFGCTYVRSRLLPESNEVFLNIERKLGDGSTETISQRFKVGAENSEVLGLVIDYNGDENVLAGSFESEKFSITSVETSYSSLSPKRRLLYKGCGIAMVALPVVYALVAVVACGVLFYKRRLKEPIEILSDATERIAKEDLDFKVAYERDDELGALCDSFERMREALVDNNLKMWNMIEERKRLQSSVAHDIRNPIAIIKSHAEYLKIKSSEGNMTGEKTVSIAGNIENAADRLQAYSESVQMINHLEDLEVHKEKTDASKLLVHISDDLSGLLKQKGISLNLINNVDEGELNIDSQVLYRIVENLVDNAARYAKKEIVMSFQHKEQFLVVSVIDDGKGFSDMIMKSKNALFISGEKEKGHLGMGLSTCRILSEKHGGYMEIFNRDGGGGIVRVKLAVD